MIGIYMYTDKDNGKRYIGQSTNINKRKTSHRNSDRTPFDRILSLKGEDKFDFVILEECEASQLNEREIYWINYYNSYYDGYNCNPGGNSVYGEYASGALITEEVAKQIIQDLCTSTLSQKEIAKKYGCSEDIVRSINVCRTWTHLHSYEKNIALEAGTKQQSMPTYLSQTEILQIVDLLANTQIPQTQIAEQFNVSRGIINKINQCEQWENLHSFSYNIRAEAGNNNEKLYMTSKLTKEQALEIINLLSTTSLTQGEIAKRFNVSSSTIYSINSCQVYTEYHNYKNNIRQESNIIQTYHKIDTSTILQVIELLANTKLTYKQIANKCNLSEGTITQINTCHSYTNLHSYKNNIRQETQGINTRPLTEDKVLQIIDLLEHTTLSQEKIANQFNISRTMVGHINQCKSWTQLHNYKNNIRQEAKNDSKGRLPQSTVLKVIDLLAHTDKSHKEIALLCNIGVATVTRINTCKCWTSLHTYKHNIRQEAKLTNK